MIVIADIVALPLIYLHAIESAQKPLAFLISSIKLTMDGLFVLGILTSILYFRQFRRFWIAHCLILLLLGLFVFKGLANGIKSKYASKEKTVALAK